MSEAAALEPVVPPLNREALIEEATSEQAALICLAAAMKRGSVRAATWLLEYKHGWVRGGAEPDQPTADSDVRAVMAEVYALADARRK